MQCSDWETSAAFWRLSKTYGEQGALDHLSRTFNDEYPRKGMAFAMGTVKARPKQWLLLGVIRLDELRQQASHSERREMNETERSRFLAALDDEILKGGVTLSEWCALIVCQSDIAFIASADLAAIVTALAGIETYLRTEYPLGKKGSLFDLIEQSPLADELKRDIHALRIYRNQWVHVADPEDDADLQIHPERYVRELEDMARGAVRTLRRTIYENQWV